MSIRAIFSLAGIIVVAASLSSAQEIPLAVQLTGPLSVSSAHRGDLIAAQLEIDGYTDSVGNGPHNRDLSKRRAQAVQSVLVAQCGVDAVRLSANGFGADQPIGSNDTPDGRAQNRRVEFLKK